MTPCEPPVNHAVNHEHARLARRIDEAFADVLRRLDDLARRTDHRFADIEARAAALAAHVDAQAARILDRLPPRPAAPPPPAHPPRRQPRSPAPANRQPA